MRTAAWVGTVAGAIGSAALTLYAGRQSAAPVAVILIAGWVVAPFVAFLLAERASIRWSALARMTMHVAMLLVSLGSLAIYGIRVLSSSSTQAFVFVIIPPLTVVVVAVGVALAALRSRGAQHARRGQ